MSHDLKKCHVIRVRGESFKNTIVFSNGRCFEARNPNHMTIFFRSDHHETFFLRSRFKNRTTSNSNFYRQFYHSSDFDSITYNRIDHIFIPEFQREKKKL